jgi:hypothetical protein
MFAVALPLFMLGALTWLGTIVTVHVRPLTPPEFMPVYYRQRFDAFAARGRMLMYAAAVPTAVGAVLLIGWY